MKITANINVTVLGKEANISESTGRESYKLAILQGSEAGNISCSKDVFDVVKPMHSYVVAAVYDDKYQYMKLSSVDLKTEKPIGVATK